jgi:hypothetical protein
MSLTLISNPITTDESGNLVNMFPGFKPVEFIFKREDQQITGVDEDVSGNVEVTIESVDLTSLINVGQPIYLYSEGSLYTYDVSAEVLSINLVGGDTIIVIDSPYYRINTGGYINYRRNYFVESNLIDTLNSAPLFNYYLTNDGDNAGNITVDINVANDLTSKPFTLASGAEQNGRVKLLYQYREVYEGSSNSFTTITDEIIICYARNDFQIEEVISGLTEPKIYKGYPFPVGIYHTQENESGSAPRILFDELNINKNTITNNNVLFGFGDEYGFLKSFYNLTPGDDVKYLSFYHDFQPVSTADSFIFTIVTTSNNTNITLPLNASYNYAFDVNWGDGSEQKLITTWNDTDKTHLFETAGTYQITITGTCQAFLVDNGSIKSYIDSIDQWGDIDLRNVNFYGCSNLNSVVTGMPATLVSCYQLFRDCFGLFSIPTDLFENCSNVTTFEEAFSYNCAITSFSATQFINCSSVTNVKNMFYASDMGTLPAGMFDAMPLITDMEGCFSYCLFTSVPSGFFDNQPLVTNIKWLFRNANITTVPSGLFDIFSNVTTMEGLFYESSISSLPANILDNLTSVTNGIYFCRNATNLSSLPNELFRYNSLLSSLNSAFFGCSSLTSIPTDLFFNVPSLTNLADAFRSSGLTSVPAGLFSNFTIASCNLDSIFRSCTSLTTINQITGTTTSLRLTNAFRDCTSLTTVPNSTFLNVEIYPGRMFQGCTGITSVNSPFISVSFVASTSEELQGYIFKNCTALASIGNFMFSGVSNFYVFDYIFENCTSLTDLSSFVFDTATGNAIRARGTFKGCTGLTDFATNIFDDHSGTFAWMEDTFSGCTSLNSIPDFENNLNKLGLLIRIFDGCTSLTGSSHSLWLTDTEGHSYDTYTLTAPNYDSGVPNGLDCYRGCTGLTDYASIPLYWK